MLSPPIRSPSWGVGFWLESLDLWLESPVFVVKGILWGLVLFSRDLQMLPPHWKRRSWFKSLIIRDRGHVCVLILFSRDLQMSPSCWKRRFWLGALIFIYGRGHIGVLVLFTRDLQSSFLSFRGEGLDLEGLSLDRKSLIWGRVLMVDLVVLGGEVIREWMRALKMKGIRGYL